MKKINIQCYDNGRATLKTKDIHIESENIASIIEVDFSQVEYKNYQKGLDIESGSYLLRYFLGNDEVVFKELTYENTLPGELVITPFVFDEVNDRKVRYLTDNSVIIHKRRSIASQDVPDNADLILEEVKKFLEETTDKLVVDMVFNKDTKLLSLILENGDEISTIIDLSDYYNKGEVDGLILNNQEFTYDRDTIDIKDANTLQQAKDYTYSKVEIDNKDTAIMNKANNLENANMFKDVNYNNLNGVLTFTKYDDTTKEIDLPLELIVTSGYYDEVTNELVLVLANSSEIRIPVDNLLTDLDAHNIRFKGSGTNYLVNKNDVESAVKELDTRVKTNADNVALKVNTSDIVNNLNSTDTNKPLSANQGKVLNDILDNKVDISKQVPKTPDMICRVGIDDNGSLWYVPYRVDIIKVREMNSLDASVSYEGTLQPNLTHVDNGDIRVYSNTFDHVFPFNEMKESVDLFNNKFIDVPVIYWKFYHDSSGNLTGYDISNKKVDDTFDTFPVHAKGKLSIGKYQGYSQGGKLYSISAVYPSMSKTIASFRVEAKAVGDDYFANDWQSWNMLQLLLTAYFGTKNTDLYFPDVNGEKSNTGTMDGYKTAVNLATGKNVFFGIENIVKNGYHFIDGVINNNEEVWFAHDHTKYSNVITEDYVLKGTKPTQNGYIKNYGGGLGLFPTENTGASSTTYYCDYLYCSPVLSVLFSGSYWGASASRGVWHWSAYNAFSNTYSVVGSRLIQTS